MACRFELQFGVRTNLLRLSLLSCVLLLGGGLTVLVGVQTMFSRDRSVAVDAAPILFDIFQWIALALTSFALLTSIGGYAFKRGKAASVALLLSVGASAFVSFYVMPKMDHLQAIGESGSDAFKSLHGQSMIAVLGLLGGALVATVLMGTLMTSKTRT